MTIILEVKHVTTYRYARPVAFGEHRVMFRPREAHDIRVMESGIETNVYSEIRWIQDTFSNSVALVTPREHASDLRIECMFTVEHFGVRNLELPLEDRATHFPMAYTADEQIDLSRYLAPHTDDPDGVLNRWAHEFVVRGDTATRPLLTRITREIRDGFTYQGRDTEGTQSPLETLASRSGTCRDFAWLMIEALRRLGFAARFVSGYLYDPSVDGGAVGIVGAGATHAWLHVYLPGAGWVPYDPTNRLFGGTELIRVAYARHPTQAAPLTGSWTGAPGDYLGMNVEVKVTKIAEFTEPSL